MLEQAKNRACTKAVPCFKFHFLWERLVILELKLLPVRDFPNMTSVFTGF